MIEVLELKESEVIRKELQKRVRNPESMKELIRICNFFDSQPACINKALAKKQPKRGYNLSSIIYKLACARKQIEEEQHFSEIKTNDAARSALKDMGVEIGTLDTWSDLRNRDYDLNRFRYFDLTSDSEKFLQALILKTAGLKEEALERAEGINPLELYFNEEQRELYANLVTSKNEMFDVVL